MLEDLKLRVCAANKALQANGLVVLTWGNASGYDPDSKAVVIKPSGVSYGALRPEDLVVLDLDGNVLEGALRPSSDTPTHLALYRAFPSLRGIVHTHSTFATAFAQANRDIPVYGTTHADHFDGPVPCARQLTPEEIEEGYEKNTGAVIVEEFCGKEILLTPAALLPGHGAFTWGSSVEGAVHNAIALEEVAKMAYLTETLSSGTAKTLSPELQRKHYERKHGSNAYYGQKK